MSTFEKVKELIVEQLGVDRVDVTPDSMLINDLGADSLDVVELVMAIEEEYCIEIPDRDAEEFLEKPISHIVDYIDRNK